MTIFFTADTHFGHEKAVNYHTDGIKLRPWSTTQDQDQVLKENWNKVVGPDDLVYHIGDVYDTSIASNEYILNQLNGRKILIKGNLDIADTSEYLKYFDEVYDTFHTVTVGSITFLLSHFYTTREILEEYHSTVNLHGHLHADCVQDPRYFCVSLERTNFCPISAEQLLVSLSENQLKFIKNIKF